jgi:hypothetical protein
MENSETTIAAEPAENSTAPADAAPAPEAVPAEPATDPPLQPKPKGRPQGAKDRQPRTRRPTVRVEPLPEREPPREHARERQPAPAHSRAPTPEPARIPERQQAALAAHEEPPSPRTLYRETSQRLVHLRGILNENRQSEAANRYTSRLSTWAA